MAPIAHTIQLGRDRRIHCACVAKGTSTHGYVRTLRSKHAARTLKNSIGKGASPNATVHQNHHRLGWRHKMNTAATTKETQSPARQSRHMPAVRSTTSSFEVACPALWIMQPVARLMAVTIQRPAVATRRGSREGLGPARGMIGGSMTGGTCMCASCRSLHVVKLTTFGFTSRSKSL